MATIDSLPNPRIHLHQSHVKLDNIKKHILTNKKDLINFAQDTHSEILANNKDIGSFLNGDWIKELENSSKDLATTNYAKTVSAYNDLYTALSAIEKKKKDLDRVSKSEFRAALDTFLKQVNQDYYKKGYSALLSRRIKSKAKNKLTGYASVDERIQTALLSKTGKSGSIFKVNNEEDERFSTSFAKLSLLKNNLKYVPVSIESGGAKLTESEWWDRVILLAKSWSQDFLNQVGEVAGMEGFISASEKGLSQFVNAKISRAGAKQINITERIDPKLLKDLESVKSGKNTTVAQTIQYQTSKADYVIKGDFVSGSIGVSDKQYKTVNIDNGIISHIKIQDSSTSLLVYLIRDAGFSQEKIYSLLSIVGSLPNIKDGDYIGPDLTSSMESYWNEFKETVQYQGLLSTLAGIPKTPGYSYFMNINGNILTMSEVLNQLANPANQAHISKTNQEGAGWNYNEYQSARRKIFEKYQDNKISQYDNSKMEMMRIMQSAKMQINLNYLNLFH